MEDSRSQEVKVHFADGHSGTEKLFNLLSQIDADYALAKALQEQEGAAFLARLTCTTSDNEESVGSASSSSAFAGGFDLNSESQLKRDEALARALQDADDQEQLVKMLSVIGLQESNGTHQSSGRNHDERNNVQDDIDPDSMSYEELMALSEAVGSLNKGLTEEELAALPVKKYKTKCCLTSKKNEHCVICYQSYEKGVSMITLPCKHPYHADCIRKWLEISKACPICGGEVTTTKGKKSE